jgi:hypothetical protein
MSDRERRRNNLRQDARYTVDCNGESTGEIALLR